MKQLGFILLLLTLSFYLKAQTDYDSIPQKFFELFKDKGSDAAIDYVYSSNDFIKQNIQANIKVKTELKKITSLLGSYRGYELMKTTVYSPSYVKLTYLAKFDRQPLKFIFILYKPKDKWQIQRMRFDDKITDEKQRTAK